MKELSIEQKAKAYDEAIRKAKEKYAMFEGMKQGDVLEDIFPELKEDEDEKIRKWLIGYFNQYKIDGFPEFSTGMKADSIIAWLEKQGEQKEINLVEILKHYPRETELYSPLYGKLWLAEVDEKSEIIYCYKHSLDEGCTRAVLEQEDIISFYSNGTTGLPDFSVSKDCMLFLYNTEKQGEQKPVPDWMPKFLDELRSKKNYFDWDEHRDIEGGILAIIKWMNPNYFNGKDDGQKSADKVEPKFKVGDWIIAIDGEGNRTIEKIIEFCGDEVRLVDTNGYYTLWPQHELNYYHLWSIQDAKDGDILDANGAPFIYKKHDKDYVYFYCGVNLAGEFIEANGIGTWNNNNNKVYPPTKEQRDLLFVKMKEAGYEWIAEKKELKKIETSDCNPDNLIEESYQQQADDLIDMVTDYIQQKSAWSKVDEVGLGDALWAIEQARTIAKDENDMGNLWYAERWLKSLKGRVQPQPKQEWSEEDETHRHWILEMLKDGEIKTPEFADHFKAAFNWLKSLRPQNRWKPSDEQMEALNWVAIANLLITIKN